MRGRTSKRQRGKCTSTSPLRRTPQALHEPDSLTRGEGGARDHGRRVGDVVPGWIIIRSNLLRKSGVTGIWTIRVCAVAITARIVKESE